MSHVTEDKRPDLLPGSGNIQVSEVIFSRDDVRFLSRNVEFLVEWDAEDGVFILFNEEFSIVVRASTLKQAMLEINDSFRLLYDRFFPGDGNSLTDSAVVLKRRLAELFKYNSEL